MLKMTSAVGETVANKFERDSITKTETIMVRVQPSDAQNFLNVAHEGQRDVKERHVTYLEECFKRGEFNPYEPITIIRCNKTGRFGLVNGNHRMRMIVRLASSVKINITYIWSDDFDADFSWLYATFDKGKARTNADILAVYGEHKKLGITTNQANIIASAANIVEHNFSDHFCGVDYSSRSGVRQHELLVKNGDNGKLYFEDIAGASKTILRVLSRSDMAAVALSMYNNDDFDQEKVREFWRKISSGVFVQGEAEKALYESLVDENWKRRPRENKRAVVYNMFSRSLAGATVDRISAYRAAKKDKPEGKSKKGVVVNVIGSNNSVQI